MSRLIDLTGRVFGRLTVLNRAENSPTGKVRWLCRCACGTELPVRGTLLVSGLTRSCGCLHQERVRKLSERAALARMTADLGDIADLFWSKVQKTSSCWIWTGTKRKDGYGVQGFNRTTLRAHRVSWMLTHGGIPEGMDVLHRCDVAFCVRPTHLFLGTQLDNMRDMITKGRRSPTHGEGTRRAKLTEAEVLEIRARYAAGAESYNTLADWYGVARTTIGDVLTQRNWKHI